MEFVNIPEYEAYSINKNGVVKNNKTGRILRQYEEPSGYIRLTLMKNGKPKRLFVHRLVGNTFISNEKQLPQINHIDGNKKNNSVENLEWVTLKENQQHRRNILKKGLVKVRCVETGLVYESIKKAAQENNSCIPNIVRACKNRSTANGKHWEYVKER